MFNMLLPALTGLIDKVIPDKGAAEKAKSELEQQIAAAQVQLDLAQTEINKEEAKSESLFKSGWRPAVGWMCVTGLGLVYVVFPVIEAAGYIAGYPMPMPAIQHEALYALLTGVLGMSGIRSFDKRKN